MIYWALSTPFIEFLHLFNSFKSENIPRNKVFLTEKLLQKLNWNLQYLTYILNVYMRSYNFVNKRHTHRINITVLFFIHKNFLNLIKKHCLWYGYQDDSISFFNDLKVQLTREVNILSRSRDRLSLECKNTKTITKRIYNVFIFWFFYGLLKCAHKSESWYTFFTCIDMKNIPKE